MSKIELFFTSDMETIEGRDRYLGHAKNVQSGHHTELELTGNAFNFHFSTAGVIIENLWDEEFGIIELSLNDFIDIVSKWLPNSKRTK